MLELYALGVLEAEEHLDISRHLIGDCKVCNRNLRTAIGLNSAILTSAPEVAATASLRRRVLSGVLPQKASRPWAWMGLAAALAAGAVWTGIDSRNKAAELGEVRREKQFADREVERLNTSFAFLRNPQTRPASAKPGATGPRGTYFISPTGVLLIASNLAALDPGKTYAMWVIPKGQSPKPAGLFRPDANGTAVHFRPEAVDVQSAQALALSVEPEAGSAAPTSTPFLITPVVGL